MASGPPKYDWPAHWPKRDHVSPSALGLILCIAVAFVLVGVVGGVWTISRFFQALAANDHTAIRNVGFIFLAVFGAPFVIWRALVSQGMLNRAKDRDYADLFTKAVEQLGVTRDEMEYSTPDEFPAEIGEGRSVTKANIEVRLGAIYALERISRGSEDDHIAIMETLCAYVRENARADETVDSASLDMASLYKIVPPRTDIMAAVSVIGRRDDDRIRFERADERAFDKYSIDLRKANLRRQSFSGAKLDFANLNGASLDGAGFTSASMEGVRLRFASLRYAKFADANLTHANLTCADMSGARGLTAEMLATNFGCRGTKIPESVRRPRNWFSKKLDNREDAERYYQAWLDGGWERAKELEQHDRSVRAEEEEQAIQEAMDQVRWEAMEEERSRAMREADL